MLIVDKTQKVSSYDVVVIGAGPAGLSCALNLVRANLRVLVIDSNRPRHSATLKTHGFLTRDGVSPSEFRKLAREEFLSYPAASFEMAEVIDAYMQKDRTFVVFMRSVRDKAAEPQPVLARRVVVAVGLHEELPEIENIRTYYGTSLHSCGVCDGYEKTSKELVLLPHPEISNAAVKGQIAFLRHYANRVTAVKNAVAVLGEKGQMTGVQRESGRIVKATSGFVIPKTTVRVPFLEAFEVPAELPAGFSAWEDAERWSIHERFERRGQANTLISKIEQCSNTMIPGLYAAGEAYWGQAEQLIIAAGHGAEVANMILNQWVDIKELFASKK